MSDMRTTGDPSSEYLENRNNMKFDPRHYSDKTERFALPYLGVTSTYVEEQSKFMSDYDFPSFAPRRPKHNVESERENYESPSVTLEPEKEKSRIGTDLNPSASTSQDSVNFIKARKESYENVATSSLCCSVIVQTIQQLQNIKVHFIFILLHSLK